MFNILKIYIFFCATIIDPASTAGVLPKKLAKCIRNGPSTICIPDSFLYGSIIQIAQMGTPFKISDVIIILNFVQMIYLRQMIGIWNERFSYQPMYKAVFLAFAEP